MREATAETATERLWQPEVLLPSQINSRKLHMDLPELQLVAAILEDAIHCVARYAHTRDRRRAREYRDAREWLLDDRRDWMFSFHNVCELLSLEARAVRVWVLNLLDQQRRPSTTDPDPRCTRRDRPVERRDVPVRRPPRREQSPHQERFERLGWDEV
jgi:hypothetical protein